MRQEATAQAIYCCALNLLDAAQESQQAMMDVLHDASDSKSDKPFDPETLGRAQALLEAIQEFDPEKQTHDSWNGKTSHSDAADETVQSSASEEQARSAEQEEEIFHNDTTPRYTKEIHHKKIDSKEIQNNKITKHNASVAKSLHQLHAVIMKVARVAEAASAAAAAAAEANVEEEEDAEQARVIEDEDEEEEVDRKALAHAEKLTEQHGISCRLARRLTHRKHLANQRLRHLKSQREQKEASTDRTTRITTTRICMTVTSCAIRRLYPSS